MKAIHFCVNPYAFEILYPLHREGINRNAKMLWYIPDNILPSFSYSHEVTHTQSLKDLREFRSDVIFVPGNEVPHYLRGVKVQVFHGLAGEKKGHFRIRHYFDLYLTQGPYFTERFRDLSTRYGDFTVAETGWSKLDNLFEGRPELRKKKQEILERSGRRILVLYAPTFSPSLTSAPALLPEIIRLAKEEDLFLLIKFHDLMDKTIISNYVKTTGHLENIRILNQSEIIDLLIMSDLMISDTSSVVYEFMLLDKPVVTFNTRSRSTQWLNFTKPVSLLPVVRSALGKDEFSDQRRSLIERYHPYTDGKSSARIWEAVAQYITEHGVPEYRVLSLYRRYKINSMFGRSPR